MFETQQQIKEKIDLFKIDIKYNHSMFNNKNLEKMVRIFRMIRNKLAHLEKVDIQHLLAIELKTAESIIKKL